VQIAALATQEKVAELQGKLNDAGIKSYTQKVTTQSGTRIRVRVGPFASKEEAEKMRAKLVQLGYGGTLVPAN
jgi:DedD protein